MKSQIRKLFRLCGLEINRYHPLNSDSVQLVMALVVSDTNVVFDIGANVGQFGREIREFGYKGKIVSFEPLTDARKILLDKASHDPAWVVHEQAAIGDQDGEIDIHIAGNSVSSSVLPMLKSHSNAAVESAYIASERVPVIKLDSVADRFLAPGSNLFIKIDTQGFEWQVLDGARGTLQQATGVLCELSLVPLYDGQRLWRDVVDRLDSEGFMLWVLQRGFTNPATGQSLQMDGIFLRKDLVQSVNQLT